MNDDDSFVCYGGAATARDDDLRHNGKRYLSVVLLRFLVVFTPFIPEAAHARS